MKSPKLIATAIVSAFVCVPSQFVSAESPLTHRSQQRPFFVAWNDAWGDDHEDDDEEDGDRQRNRYYHQQDSRRVGHRDDSPELADDDRSVSDHDGADRGDSRLTNSNFEAQRRHEERELERQLDRAARLRQINQQTGNPQLIDIADRMEQRALEHYKQQLNRISDQENRSPQTLPVATDQQNDPANDAPLVSILKSKPPTVKSPQPTGTSSTQPDLAPRPQRSASPPRVSDHLQRHLVNEQKVLQQRLDAADRLRQLGSGPDGNERLLETADRMERRAWEQFEQRVEHLTESPKTQPQHDRDRYVTDEPDHIAHESEHDVEKVEYRVAPKQPVRRVFQGLRNAIGR